MRYSILAGSILTLSVSTVHAGPVTFDPPVQYVNPAAASTVEIEVSVPSFDVMTSINMLRFVIGSNSIPMVDFEFDDDFCANEFVACDAYIPGIAATYPNEVELTAYIQMELTAPLTVGILTVDISSLWEGPHTLTVDAALDNERSYSWSLNSGGEFMTGSTTIHVVPEPGCLVMVGIGMIAFGRRRRWGWCVLCGYDLTGNESGVCPECGAEV